MRKGEKHFLEQYSRMEISSSNTEVVLSSFFPRLNIFFHLTFDAITVKAFVLEVDLYFTSCCEKRFRSLRKAFRAASHKRSVLSSQVALALKFYFSGLQQLVDPF